MKQSMLTAPALREALDYDPDTGVFTWKKPPSSRVRVGQEAGNVGTNGRRSIGLSIGDNGERHLAHRLAWLWLNNEWPDGNVVPKNGDYLDVSADNLVLEAPAVTASKGSMARSYNSTSGVKGVSFDKSRGNWQAYIQRGYGMRSLGRFDTLEGAVAARRAAEIASPPSATIISAELSAEALQRAKDRRVWLRAQKDSGGHTSWPSRTACLAEVGRPPTERHRLTAIRQDDFVGPGNWEWAEGPLSSRKMGRGTYDKEHRRQFPMVHRGHNLKRDFGITLAQYQAIFVAQGGACASCKMPEEDRRDGNAKWLAVDHDHKTGAIRGLLCTACNTGIGQFVDDPALLRAAADYLDRHAAQTAPNDSVVIPLNVRGRRNKIA